MDFLLESINFLSFIIIGELQEAARRED